MIATFDRIQTQLDLATQRDDAKFVRSVDQRLQKWFAPSWLVEIVFDRHGK